jgi:hypothetical protein
LFSLFSRKKTNKLTKHEYWEKWCFFELLDALKLVEKVFDKKYGSEKFEKLREVLIHSELLEAIDEIEFWNRNDLNEVDRLFNSINNFSKLVGKEVEESIRLIKDITKKWKREEG